MTLRDDFKELCTNRGSRLTRNIDLRRSFSYVHSVEMHGNSLLCPSADPLPGGARDGSVARHWKRIRLEAESRGRRILDEFVQLETGDSAAVLNFARTWGPLELCPHNLPYQHDPVASLPVPLSLPPQLYANYIRRVGEFQLTGCFPLGFEPIATWVFFARQAAAILRIFKRLRMRSSGNPLNWGIVFDETMATRPIDDQQICLTDVTQAWLNLGACRPSINRGIGGIQWTGADLFGELAVHLALSVQNVDGQAYCARCGKPFIPKKRPTRGLSLIHI